MPAVRPLILGLTLVLTAGACLAQQAVGQRGPTGDNRAATGHPAVQTPPTQSAREKALQKTPRAAPEVDGTRNKVDKATAHNYTTPGTPAENGDQ